MRSQVLAKIIKYEGLEACNFHHARYGRNSATYYVTPPAGGEPKLVIQIPKAPAKYQCRKKAHLYQLVRQAIGTQVPHATLRQIDSILYLVMSYCPGVPLSDVSRVCKLDRKEIVRQLGVLLGNIHERVVVGDLYGWWAEMGLAEGWPTFADYLSAEVLRIQSLLMVRGYSDEVKAIIKRALPVIEPLKALNSKPVLVWYDLHPDNIIVSPTTNPPEISGLLDPGAARVGPREWDLAHAREYVCLNDAEWYSLLAGYATSANEMPDLAACERFRVLILLDDISLNLSGRWAHLSTEALDRIQKRLTDMYS
jgi:hypothetical protein